MDVVGKKLKLCFFFQFIGGKKAVEEHAAVWVPDVEAPNCMHCKKTQFTLINRRVSVHIFMFFFPFLFYLYQK